MTYVIAEPCVDLLDKACIEECPVDCIYEGARMLYIHPDECVDCGACEPVCPVEAIYYEDDVKEEWAAYTKANVDFFDELGSPGGASKVGKVDADPQWIKDLPPVVPRRVRALHLPDFPWDSLAADKALAAAHPDGIVDLSVGHPGGPRPRRRARRARRAGRRRAGLPDHARHATSCARRSPGRWRAGSGSRSTRTTSCRRSAPRSSSPGCRRCSGSPRATSSSSRRSRTRPTRWARCSPAPSSCGPTGCSALGPAPPGAGLAQLAVEPDRPGAAGRAPAQGRGLGAGARARSWRPTSATCRCPRRRTARTSVLHPDVCDGDHTGLLAVHSMSKSSSLAGYRAGFVTGDPGAWSRRCWRCASTPG